MATALCHTDSYTLSGKGDPLTEGDLFYPGTCLFNRPGHFLWLFSATQHGSRVQPRLKVQPASWHPSGWTAAPLLLVSHLHIQNTAVGCQQ